MRHNCFKLCILLSLAAPALLSASTEQIAFDVFLNDKRIGEHLVSIDKRDNRKEVTVKADFSVKFLAIPFYQYEHTANELWADGCIREVSTRTNDNGDKLSVDSKQTEQALKILTEDGAKSIEGCVRTFAYWNPELLDSDFLLNTQTGEYERSQLKSVGETPLLFDGKKLGDRKYQLQVSDKPSIALWYSSNNEWLALQTEVSDKNTLTYVKRQTN